MSDEAALPGSEASSQPQRDRKRIPPRDGSRTNSHLPNKDENAETDPPHEILVDLNATGNQAIKALYEVSEHLSIAEHDLEDTRETVALILSHEELVYQGGILALLKAIESKDELTGYHIQRMVLFSIEIARVYGIIDTEEIKAIVFISALHDVGKVGIRDEVLNKPGFLSDDEREHVENHASIGAAIVENLPGWEEIRHGVLSHHEWWDGTGYPNGLTGEQISLATRIVALADVFDAITSLRPYRQPFPYFAARIHIERESESHFDPQVVSAFLEVPESRWEELRRKAETSTLESLLHAPLSELDLDAWCEPDENEENRPSSP